MEREWKARDKRNQTLSLAFPIKIGTQYTSVHPVISRVFKGFQGWAPFYFPTWWYDMPQALYSFFDEYDFSGKTLIPFNVHNGSRFSGTIDTIKELEPDATVVEDGFTVSERDVAEASEDVAEWLNGLGY
ncbi:hypothetical protein LI221_13730 [Faecalimonas umbilicata]|nr:hypothetical protein [Faecalimonas umbilicata]